MGGDDDPAMATVEEVTHLVVGAAALGEEETGLLGRMSASSVAAQVIGPETAL
ncbi:hypothetical protein LguiA_016764 [Lonicera macranthoides]